jgi:hypothetical protein
VASTSSQYRSLTAFQIAAHMRARESLDEIVKSMNDMRAEQARILDLQISAQEIGTHALASLVGMSCLRLPLELLARLRPIHNARHTSDAAPTGCLDNTRVDVLERLMSWADGSGEAKSVFWLSGMAGTGKSAIARTLCEKLAGAGLLGASFFVSRTAAERRDPSNIVRTVVHHLAHTQPHLRPHICTALRDSPLVADEGLSSQLRTLVAEPISRASHPDRPVVVVIDGLDECEKDKDTGREGGQLLPLLLETFRGCQSWLKLLVVSRHEPTIRDIFAPFQPAIFQLHQVNRSTVQADITRYLVHCLAEISEQRKSKLPPGWPTQDVIVELVRRSGALFVYASTVVKLLQHSRLLPDEILRTILSPGSQPGLYGCLDELYLQVLRIAVDVGTPGLHAPLLSRLRKMLGVLAVLQSPVSVKELALLLEVDKRVMRLDLESISAVIVMSEDDSAQVIQIFHGSFVEFLQDPRRCTESFSPDVRASHDLLSVRTATWASGFDAGNAVYSTAFWEYHTQRASLSAQKEIVNVWRGVLQNHPAGHEGRLGTLEPLVSALNMHYARGGGMRYLTEAIHHQREVMTLMGNNDRAVNELAFLLHTQFKQTGQVVLLDEAIELFREGLALRPPGHPNRGTAAINLASVLQTQFEQTGQAVLLDEATELFREGLALRPPGHPRRDSAAINLASVLLTQFDQTGQAVLLDEATELFREGLALRPPGHPRRDSAAINLASVLQKQFEQNGQVVLLDEATELFREGLALRPPGHPSRDIAAINLANALLTQFEQTGQVVLLDEATDLFHEALELCPPGHPYRGTAANNLGNVLLTRFEQTNQVVLLDEATELFREWLALCPPGHPRRDIAAINLATVLQKQFEQNGQVVLLDKATDLFREALELCPPGHPRRDSAAINLADVLHARFKQTGQVVLLDEATDLYREGLVLRPQGHPTRSIAANNLAAVLQTWYKQTEQVVLLDEATALFREGLELCPPGHHGRDAVAINLADVLWTRFKQTGQVMLLDEATDLYREGLELRPPGHPRRDSAAINLADVLHARFKQTGQVVLLDEATDLLREGLALRPPGHHRRDVPLHSLASVLIARSRQYNDPAPLTEAVALLREELTICSAGHPDYEMCLLTLADSLMLQAAQSDVADTASVMEAAEHYRTVLARTPLEHPHYRDRQKGLLKALRMHHGFVAGDANMIHEIEQLKLKIGDIDSDTVDGHDSDDKGLQLIDALGHTQCADAT